MEGARYGSILEFLQARRRVFNGMVLFYLGNVGFSDEKGLAKVMKGIPGAGLTLLPREGHGLASSVHWKAVTLLLVAANAGVLQDTHFVLSLPANQCRSETLCLLPSETFTLGTSSLHLLSSLKRHNIHSASSLVSSFTHSFLHVFSHSRNVA